MNRILINIYSSLQIPSFGQRDISKTACTFLASSDMYGLIREYLQGGIASWEHDHTGVGVVGGAQIH